MKRSLFALFAMITLMFSCTGNNKNANGADDAGADSIDSTDTAVVETQEQLIEDTPMPKAADELFDDFIFNFAANKKLQKERILFPLKETHGRKTDFIPCDKWRMEHFFMRQGYYTLLLDSRRQLNIMKDTAVHTAVVEHISISNNRVKQYIFERIRGRWMLSSINHQTIAQNHNGEFLAFYQHFVTDSAFQAESINETVAFVGPDPDDDFAQMEGIITPDTWSAFAPELPANTLYNIVYGKPTRLGNTKILVMRGIANGLELEIVFTKKAGKWLVTRLTT